MTSVRRRRIVLQPRNKEDCLGDIEQVSDCFTDECEIQDSKVEQSTIGINDISISTKSNDFDQNFTESTLAIKNCQNPNLTSTQPNLNLVGFDTIIAVHTTHPTPPPPGTLLLLEIKVLVV